MNFELSTEPQRRPLSRMLSTFHHGEHARYISLFVRVFRKRKRSKNDLWITIFEQVSIASSSAAKMYFEQLCAAKRKKSEEIAGRVFRESHSFGYFSCEFEHLTLIQDFLKESGKVNSPYLTSVLRNSVMGWMIQGLRLVYEEYGHLQA